jgi:hypothetical protein
MKKNNKLNKIKVAIFGAGGIARKAFLPIISIQAVNSADLEKILNTSKE